MPTSPSNVASHIASLVEPQTLRRQVQLGFYPTAFWTNLRKPFCVERFRLMSVHVHLSCVAVSVMCSFSETSFAFDVSCFQWFCCSWGFTPRSFVVILISPFSCSMAEGNFSDTRPLPPWGLLLTTHSPFFSSLGSFTIRQRRFGFYASPASTLDLHPSIFAVKKERELCLRWFVVLCFSVRLVLRLHARPCDVVTKLRWNNFNDFFLFF